LALCASSGPSPAKESARAAVRRSASAIRQPRTKVEARMRKAVASRKPRTHQIAGSNRRLEKLILRLHRTGKNWTI
jgi:tight adherence protein B